MNEYDTTQPIMSKPDAQSQQDADLLQQKLALLGDMHRMAQVTQRTLMHSLCGRGGNYIYTSTCQGVPLWHPLGRGCQNGAPLFPSCFSTCFGSSGIYVSFLLSEATEAMLLSFFGGHLKNGACQTCHSRVGWICRGAKTPPL